eukprot:CAMPEP_0175467130 /NCGR_PEP_ID=MMETSP0095-20121207/71160_1 /TAXON_ID=311494 /ORGANISM="Alexandrium monilatum, Strain CCMP3105" /LENGTH=61 /DNA_ID=CAMNT_0016768491 /DNA_START=119 /DNA_END=301 /DNA_ORIENTATION=-
MWRGAPTGAKGPPSSTSATGPSARPSRRCAIVSFPCRACGPATSSALPRGSGTACGRRCGP